MAKKAYNGIWRKVRLQVLERDQYRCQIGDRGCTGRATAVDHILPLHHGGPRLDLANLRATCSSCNSGRANRLRRRPSRVW